MNNKSARVQELEEAVVKIQDAAMHTTGDNIVPTELTYQQALSIHLRSKQLQKEGLTYSFDEKRKLKEMESCWSWLYGKA